VTRADEQRLLRVNGEKLDVPEALACLDVVFDDRLTLRTLVDSCLVAEALAEEPVRLTDQELQLAADAFRRAKGLLTPAQTYAWLEERAMSEAEFEDVVRRTAAVAALRRRVSSDARVQEYFQEHAARYATVLVAWAAGAGIGLADDPLGAVIAARRAGRPAGVSEWRVGDLPEEMAAVGSAETGVPVAVRVDGVAGTAVVIDRREAALDPATAELIARELVADWLAARRANADIEWHWGDAVRTGRAR
jgi:putative peptide maturation system protein